MSGSGVERPSVFPGFADTAGVVDRLVEIRRSEGLSQTDVAARMGTSQSAVARLESGKPDVRVSTLARYARALGRELELTIRPPGAEEQR